MLVTGETGIHNGTLCFTHIFLTLYLCGYDGYLNDVLDII